MASIPVSAEQPAANAFRVAITNNVDGISVAVVDPKAFNAVTDEALGKGIPVVAYNAQAPAGLCATSSTYLGSSSVPGITWKRPGHWVSRMPCAIVSGVI